MKRTNDLVHVTDAEFALLINFWFGASLPRPCRKRMIAAGIVAIDPGGTLHFTPGGLRWMRENAPKSDWPKPGTPQWATKNAIEGEARKASINASQAKFLGSVMASIALSESVRYRR